MDAIEKSQRYFEIYCIFLPLRMVAMAVEAMWKYEGRIV
jgi:hypothetical protein